MNDHDQSIESSQESSIQESRSNKKVTKKKQSHQKGSYGDRLNEKKRVESQTNGKVVVKGSEYHNDHVISVNSLVSQLIFRSERPDVVDRGMSFFIKCWPPS